MSGRTWTTREDAILRTECRRQPAAAIARRLRRTLSSVRNRIHNLRLQQHAWTRRTAARDRLVRKLVKQGHCNTCIAKAISPTCGRKTIEGWRRRLGLPGSGGQSTCEPCKARTRETTRRQLAAIGLPNIGHLRQWAHKNQAAKLGWPTDLRWRAVQMLEALWRFGPMTRKQIAAVVGLPWHGVRSSLKSNDPNGSYLGALIERGLVVKCSKRQRYGPRRGQSCYVYMLPVYVEPAATRTVPRGTKSPRRKKA